MNYECLRNELYMFIKKLYMFKKRIIYVKEMY